MQVATSTRSSAIVRRAMVQLGLVHLALILFALSWGGLAAAADTKTYPGSFCHPRSSFNVTSASAEGAELRTSAQIDVLCPIVKSIPGNAKLDNVTLHVNLGSTSKTASCVLSVYDSLANSTNELPLLSASGSTTGTGARTITFSNFAASGVSVPWGVSTWNSYQMACNLPSGVRVISYAVTEAGTRSETQKTYPPSMCREVDFDTSGGWFHHTRESLQFSQGNSGTNRTSVVCPVITDRKSNQGATAQAQLSVTRPAPGSGVSVTCSMAVTGNVGPVTEQVSVTVSEGAGEFPSTNLNLDLSVSPTWARYNINCAGLSRGDFRIVSYRVAESTGGSQADATNRDGKVYPGALCMGIPYGEFLNSHNSAGTFTNLNSFNAVNVWCPIINDSTASTAGLEQVDIQVHESTSGSGVTSCIVSSRGIASATPTSSVTLTAVEGAGIQELETTLPQSAAGGRYFMQCSVSPTSTIYEYEIEER